MNVKEKEKAKIIKELAPETATDERPKFRNLWEKTVGVTRTDNALGQ